MDDDRTTGGTTTSGTTTSGSGERVLGGRYRLDRVVGHGGMGVVRAAQDELLGRAADPVARAAFEQLTGLLPVAAGGRDCCCAIPQLGLLCS